MHTKLELVPIPVVDVDRAKAFYTDQLGFVADVDVRPSEGVRVVQLTPPGSACSISMGTGLPVYEAPQARSGASTWWSPTLTRPAPSSPRGESTSAPSRTSEAESGMPGSLTPMAIL